MARLFPKNHILVSQAVDTTYLNNIRTDASQMFFNTNLKNQVKLADNLLLVKGGHYMLTKNLCTYVGLVNGATCEILDIVYSRNLKEDSTQKQPAYVLCKFDDFEG